jgi:hypothetical protein
MYVRGLLTVTGLGDADFASDRSVFGTTVVVAVAVLFEVLGSFSAAVTLAVLVSAPTVVGVTTTVMVALAPASRLPTLQVTVPPDCVQLPAVEIAETSVTVPGRVSLTVTTVAGEGPLFVATIV